MKKSNLGYVLVLIAALMWGSIGIFVNGISAMGATANHDGADQIGGKDSSVFFDATQKADVNQLLDMGIKLYVQQTPTYQSVDIDAKL